MRNLIIKLTLILGVITLGAASAATDDSADFAKRVNERFPATVGAKVEPAFAGFWSIVKGNEVLFVREDLSVLIPGDVIDLRTNQSMAAGLRAANRPHISPKDLDTQDAIKLGSGSRRLFVFSDPDCPYCKQLESELVKLRNVQIFIFPFPTQSMSPSSSRRGRLRESEDHAPAAGLLNEAQDASDLDEDRARVARLLLQRADGAGKGGEGAIGAAFDDVALATRGHRAHGALEGDEVLDDALVIATRVGHEDIGAPVLLDGGHVDRGTRLVADKNEMDRWHAISLWLRV